MKHLIDLRRFERNLRDVALLLAVALLTGAVLPASATTREQKAARTPDWAAAGDAWRNAPWTADDTPFNSIRVDIDRSTAAGVDPTKTFQSWWERYQKGRTAVTIFGMSYAAYALLRAATGPKNVDAYNAMGWMYYNVERHIIPATYNFARLAFLSSGVEGGAPSYIPLGERLLNKNPYDYEVTLYQARNLAIRNHAGDADRAAQFEKEIAERNPSDPELIRVLADVAWDKACDRHSRSLANEAFGYSDQYIRRLPPNSYRRDEAEQTLQHLKALVEKWQP